MKFKSIFSFALLLLTTTATAEAARADAFRDAILDTHNRERARLGEAPLTWSDGLARGAADWARHLAKLGKLEHSSGPEGENLWMGTAGSYTTAEMVAGWLDEKKDFLPGRFPDVSRSGNWHDVGHYTQIVWRGTRTIGCAKTTGGGWDVLVCRYDPPGNWIGEAPY